MTTTTTVKSLQVTIKHKLMGVDADIRLASTYPASSPISCAKGWFAPYLFASARTPLIPRARDFAIAQFFGPFVAADYAMAHKLVAEASHVLSLCDPDPAVNIGVNRLVVLFVGIAPFRADMWSTSRRPGCGTLIFHLLDGCPALVVPVTGNAPIVAWSPWTLAQMRASGGLGASASASASVSVSVGTSDVGNGTYRAEWQHEQLCEWLDGIVSVAHLSPGIREKYIDVLGRAVSLVINGALASERAGKTVLGKVDPERAGICMFRY
ncbi:hypothetical protein M501DRAFT_924597 [Patellaria atrata CBS 101060]|uniref:Uncharacterized protein n=1 Tax=Patellaria atrata CBS 101060 TaxID=1346257 RepID=A0A9P4SJE7_9PEZI|nr:hypothetical protein M501DRAFT_924597 [Patellaria atrata CBS 101060]